MKHVPALYLATAMALQGMTKQELEALKFGFKRSEYEHPSTSRLRLEQEQAEESLSSKRPVK